MPDSPSSCLEFLVLRMRHKSVCATENPLSDSLVNGRETSKTIIIVEASAKNLERQQLSLRRRIVFRKGRLRKLQDAAIT